MKLTKTCARFLRKNGGTLLAIGASMGVVLTAIETGKATIKAEKLMELNKDIPEYDTRQKVLDCWHFYIPAAVVGAGTIGCIVGANMLSRKEIARLSAAYMALGKTYQEYRRQVAERIGREEEQQLHASVAEEVKRDKDGDVIRLFYEPATKRYFHATMADVTQASYWFNRELMTEGCVSVNAWCARTSCRSCRTVTSAAGASTSLSMTWILTGWTLSMTSRRPTTGWKSTIWHPCSTL